MLRLRTLLVFALTGCLGSIGAPGPSGDVDPLDPSLNPEGPALDPPGGLAVPSTSTRRLSNRELGNSLESLIGVRPEALALMPSDSTGLPFDRIVDAQTVGESHLSTYLAIANEVADVLVGGRRLDDIAARCSDELIPPDVLRRAEQVNGAALTGGGLRPIDDEPGSVYSLYRPNFNVGYRHEFPGAGTYELTLRGHLRSRVDELEILADGERIELLIDPGGAREVSARVRVESATAVSFDFDFRTDPPNHNLRVDFQEIVVDGPLEEFEASPAEQAACAEQLATEFAARAYRRPLADDESAALLALYNDALTTSGANRGFRQILRAIIASPFFAYLVEFGEDAAGGQAPLTQWEIAARISYGLCEMPPDAPLIDAARANTLGESAVRTEHAERLLESACGQETLSHFFAQWLRLDEIARLNKSPETFPEFDDDVRDGLVTESDAFVHNQVWEERATLSQLLRSEAYLPDPRSAFLSAEGPRMGALMLPGVLAVTASFEETAPVFRGIYILERILCEHLPDPPDSLDIVPPPADAARTSRERWAEHSSRPACASCHQAIDPIGFAFETYDSLGRYRPLENGREIDPTGGIPALGIESGTLPDALAVVDELAGADRTHSCVAQQWASFVFGRKILEADEALTTELGRLLRSESIIDAFIALVGSDAFIYRNTEGDSHE